MAKTAPDTMLEHRRSAKKAGLRYGSDREAGIGRRMKYGVTSYVDAHGRPVHIAKTLARIRALSIPPAWTDVWIAPHENDHIQATGRDAKGRKQYRYHSRWNEVRGSSKYADVIDFAKALPRIRRRVRNDLRRRGLPREKVLAAVVRLLEVSLIRVGNAEYARQNHSFGLTTMRDRHVDVHGKGIRFHFRAKSGINRDLDVDSPQLAKIVKRCQELPGQELFQYVDAKGRVRDIGSSDVNDYLREISGKDISAKDFRTWAGTSLAAQALQEFEDFDSNARAKRNVTQAIERVAAQLGNTKTVCRKCYIHPEVIAAYLDHSLLKVLQQRTEHALRTGLTSLTPEEAAVLALLQERMKRQLGEGKGQGKGDREGHRLEATGHRLKAQGQHRTKHRLAATNGHRPRKPR
jgi:DNA topoisomerase-1